MEVVVEDKQLSLAIGKGQERPARRELTGWRIDIKSEEEKRKESSCSSGLHRGRRRGSQGKAGARRP